MSRNSRSAIFCSITIIGSAVTHICLLTILVGFSAAALGITLTFLFGCSGFSES